MIGFLIGLIVGILGVVVYNHFKPTKVTALGDTIVNKVDPLKK